MSKIGYARLSVRAQNPDAATEIAHTGVVFSFVRASLLTVLVAGVLATGGCSSPSGCPPGASCPATVPFRLTFAVTVNGRSASLPRIGSLPHYKVRAGELLVINVAVTVPRRARVSALWLGISTGSVGTDKSGRPLLDPILAHSRQLLGAGLHSFKLQWRTPAEVGAATRLYLAANWASRQPPTFDVAQFVARLGP